MKSNMEKAMDRLKIDPEIRELIGKLWKHKYRTIASCSGHGTAPAYFTFAGNGDGWFEKVAHEYGFKKCERNACCEGVLLDFSYCSCCGSGSSGRTNYTAESIHHRTM